MAIAGTGMRKLFRIFAATILLSLAYSVFGESQAPRFRSREYSENDGIPVLIKHLPNWRSVFDSVIFASNSEEFKASFGNRAVLRQIDFLPGTEAASASYDAGSLLIIEFMTPQASIAADENIKAEMANGNDANTLYRRIGNYNVFVFDVSDRGAAETLLDQVRYQKSVQWLGENPFAFDAERAFVLTTRDVFISTVLFIVLGLGVAVVCGAITGMIYFRISDGRRAKLTTHSDAGGMTRLNLDGLTPHFDPDDQV